jgi:KDO2-lipid IV(A) lauroyltransferase
VFLRISSIIRSIRFRLEWLAAIAWIGAMRLLSFEHASAVAGWIGRNIGYYLPVTRIARCNIALVFPHLNTKQRESILIEMWDNLGRTLGEFPHINRLTPAEIDRIVPEKSGGEIIAKTAQDQKAAIVISAHYGNWEMTSRMAAHYGLPLFLVFRAANNPLTDALILSLRSHAAGHLAKGMRDARALVRTITSGQALGLLMDQKIGGGVHIQFFNKEATASPAAATLARGYDSPIIMARIIRLGRSARFRLEVLPPLLYNLTENKQQDVLAITQHINNVFEQWITEKPEQWFWVHKRWDKSHYNK